MQYNVPVKLLILISILILILMCLLNANGLTPGVSSMLHIYTQTIHRTIQLTTLVGWLSGIRTQSGQTKTNDELTAQKLSPKWEECGPCPVFASYTLAFALQLRKKHRKTFSQGSRRVPVGTMKTECTEQNTHSKTNT